MSGAIPVRTRVLGLVDLVGRRLWEDVMVESDGEGEGKKSRRRRGLRTRANL